MPFNDAPATDEVEVSIFGPGRGESCLIHVGGGAWIVIDSCVNRQSSVNPVIEYLERLDVDMSRSVRLVVATHAHDDHIAGISAVFDKSASAYFVLPVAMTVEEFAALVATDRRASQGLRWRAYAEYDAVARVLSSRPPPVPGQKAMKFAVQDRLLLEENGWLVRSLSPSDEATTRALKVLREHAAVVGETRASPWQDPNELAAAIWVEALDKRMLFGADLLEGPTNCGWQAVLASFRRTAKASLFKVSHHGSPGAHHPGVWSELLEDPIAVLTPFRGGHRPLPAEADLARIGALAKETYVTARTRHTDRPDAATTRAMGSIGTLGHYVRRLTEPTGHIRARSRASEEGWRVEVELPAFQHISVRA